MAASAPTKNDEATTATGKVVVLRRANLTKDVATPWGSSDREYELFDTHQLVQDSCAARTDLRLIEDSDDEVEQCLETRIDTLEGVDWRLEGGSDEAREWLTLQVKRHYSTLITNAFSARLYGYNVMERVYGIDEKGRYFVDRVLEKPFEWFVPMRDGTLRFRPKFSIILPVNDPSTSYEGLPVDTNFKFLLTRHKPTYRNPMGKALLAYLFWPWFYRKANWQFWMQFLERNGQPLLVGTAADPAQMATQMALAVQDAVMAIPIGAKVDSVGVSNKGESFDLAESKLVRRIQKVLLGQTLTSDAGSAGSGSKALGDVHDEVRQDKTIGDLKIVGPTIQNYVDALVMLNFPSSRMISLVYAVDRGLEVGRANRDAILMNTGVMEFTEKYFTREYGFQSGDFKIIAAKDRAGKNSQPGQDQQGKDGDKNSQGNSTGKDDANKDDENDD